MSAAWFMAMSALLPLVIVLATQPAGAPLPGTAIMVAGQPVDVGRAVVLWEDPRGT